MRAYRTAAGELVATQAEAGKGWTRVDIADDKAGLLAFINAERSLGGGSTVIPPSGRVMILDEGAPAPAPQDGRKCGLCQRDWNKMEAAAEQRIRGMDVQAITLRILEQSTADVERLFAALGARFAELRREAAGTGR